MWATFCNVREAGRKEQLQFRELVLALLIVFISCGVVFGQLAQPRYTLTVIAVKPMVKVGSELRLQIIQKNTTDKDQPFWVENAARLHGEYLHLIEVRQSDGKQPLRSKYFREVKDEAGNFVPGTASNGALIAKKPGEAIVSSIDLNELYELKPGKYTVRVFQKDDIGKVTVTSNIIAVTVTP
jgi:hypothetical protein